MQAAQPVADGGPPLPESGGERGAGVRVGFRELAGERAEGAAALAFPAGGLGDHHVAPGIQSVAVVEVGAPLPAGPAIHAEAVTDGGARLRRQPTDSQPTGGHYRVEAAPQTPGQRKGGPWMTAAPRITTYRTTSVADRS